MKNFFKLFASVLLCELTGLIGAIFTSSAIPNWYANLNKPFFSPPNWVFGPVWTTLYLLMGISFYLIWKQGFKKKKTKVAAKYFLAQLSLNFIWTPVFFGLKSPLLAFVIIVSLCLMILKTIQKFYKVNKIATYLLIPYLLWVSFASILNLVITINN